MNLEEFQESCGKYLLAVFGIILTIVSICLIIFVITETIDHIHFMVAHWKQV